MSVRVMGAVWDIPIPPTRKLVLMAMADHANDEGVCWPSQERIAIKVGITDRQVRNHVAELIKAGYVEVVERRMLRTTVWRITVADRKPVSAPDRKPVSASTGSQLPTNHHVEPSIEPSSTLPARKRDPVWDALVALFGDPLPSARSMYGKAAKELRDAGATPEDIVDRATLLVEAWGPTKLTINSLLKHWARFGAAAGQLTEQAAAEHATANALDAFKSGGDR